jgi:predicted O-linked N-acetylglucosamine transferase (SPINDLY family)
LTSSDNSSAFTLQDAIALHLQGKLGQAEEMYRQLLVHRPQNADLFNLLGVVAHQRERYQEALDLISCAVAIDPRVASFHANLGTSLKALGRYDEAIKCFDQAIFLHPAYAQAHYNRGNTLRELKHLEEAVKCYDKAIALKSDYVDALLNRAISLQELEQPEAALLSYDLAIELKPDNATAFCNKGIILKALNQLDAAIICYEKAVTLKPDYAEAYFNRGNALSELKHFDDALSSYNKCIELKSNCADAYLNRGIALQALRQARHAIESYDKAIELNPSFAEAYYNRGNAFFELRQFDDALKSLNESIRLKPDFVEAYVNRGNLLKELKQLEAALANYDIALNLKPHQEYLFGMRLNIKMQMCDWDGFHSDIDKLSQKIVNNEKATPCLPLLALPVSMSLQRKAAEIFVKDKFPFNPILGPIPKRSRQKRIRVGYYSADFHNHATTYLMAELFELYDKDKFELFAFSFGPDKNDEMRERVLKAVDHFIDVTNIGDMAVAQMSRDLRIDIAVDLKGLTKDTRLGIFSYRCAPIQVSYLGYPGTLGANYIDYLIADKKLIPTGSEKYYSENIVYMPDTYQVNDRKRVIPKSHFTRQEMGLPKNSFIFCCFNNNYKITPQIFGSWMRILKQVNSSVLWLLEDNSSVAANLKNEALRCGVDPERLIFAIRMPLADHLARHNLADLFLDTLPYNAHTTTSDALWAGLPVLTCTGESFASRVSASLLCAIDLPELVTTTQSEYEQLAIELAIQPNKLKAIKDRLEIMKMASTLFDSPSFSSQIENVFLKMYECYLSDLNPSHISID